MTGYRLTKLSLAIGLSVATSSALASPQSFMSARSFAMGGTGVAVAAPSDAPAENPAMMAADHHSWNDDFGLTLPSVNVRAADEEETIDQVDDIQDTIDDFEQAIDNLNQSEAQGQAAKLRDQLQAFDEDTARVNAGLGLSLAFPGPKLSVGVFANGNLTATVRGEYDENDDAILEAIENGNTLPPSGITDDLESRGKILATAVSEVGISFAREFQLANGQAMQLGVSPKYINLQTFQYTETISDFEDDDFDGDQYQTDKSGFNLDIGAAYAFGEEKQWNAGIVVKNLIPMELDSAASRPELGEEVRTLELNPMATVGIAHKSEYHVVTAEVDLTKKEAFGFEDDTQWAALGAEFDAFRYAQLRVGVRHNLASNDDNDGIEEKTQFTAGLGLNIVGVRLDIGALYSDADVGAALELGTAF
ncbi:plasmid transfer operon, TraF, protein [Marinobacter sp. es.042]|uniref:conjugal transfer protein TraF n=1 Tax=Marinobacter sp. es.042 TaxID=1761794 RepID=UPI000B615B6C|nr:conjugal transfer protein TraF [Marinobacter sp. es.042]SNB53858.1 plasmid transfer operon, TraF, protein [Marinobacter sp. es.042]